MVGWAQKAPSAHNLKFSFVLALLVAVFVVLNRVRADLFQITTEAQEINKYTQHEKWWPNWTWWWWWWWWRKKNSIIELSDAHRWYCRRVSREKIEIECSLPSLQFDFNWNSRYKSSRCVRCVRYFYVAMCPYAVRKSKFGVPIMLAVCVTAFFCHREALRVKPLAFFKRSIVRLQCLQWMHWLRAVSSEHTFTHEIENQPKKIKLKSMTWIEWVDDSESWKERKLCVVIGFGVDTRAPAKNTHRKSKRTQTSLERNFYRTQASNVFLFAYLYYAICHCCSNSNGMFSLKLNTAVIRIALIFPTK